MPLQALAGRLGLRSTLTTLAAAAWGGLTSPPLRHLGPPRDARDRKSRLLVAPAILLYRALRRTHGEREALEITGAAIHAGALRFLARALGDLDLASYGRQDAGARRAAVGRWLSRFFTAESRIDLAEVDVVGFTVTRCALVELARAAGHPELAPLFCAADAAFLASRQPPVALERPTTIAGGGATCVFRLRPG